MRTREGARGQASSYGGRYRSEPRYLTLTMSFLIRNGSPSERALAEAGNVWESMLRQRSTFAKLLTVDQHPEGELRECTERRRVT